MDYAQIDQLTNSIAFQGRVRACCTQEAGTFQADERLDIAALANDILRNGGPVFNFVRMIAAFPGLAPETQPSDATQADIPDPAILAQVQFQWPVIAALFYDESGNRRDQS